MRRLHDRDTLRTERERQTRDERICKERDVAEQHVRNIEAAYRLGRQHQMEDDESWRRRYTGHLDPTSTHQDDFDRLLSV